MDYARRALATGERNWPERCAEIVRKTKLDAAAETALWAKISAEMYLPVDEKLGLFLQQDGYLDKEQVVAGDLAAAERPINQHWSWDRILRSPYIKQADTLMGFYLFEDRYDYDCLKRHFDYYESRTVHESSLSPCIHAVLAAKLGDIDKAYELYLRTARLDLDDYNREVDEGLHITSMAGSWMAVVEGFGGKRMRDGKLFLTPQIHDNWRKYAFRILVGDHPVEVTVTKESVGILYRGPEAIVINIYGEDQTVVPGRRVVLARPEPTIGRAIRTAAAAGG